MRRGSCNCRSGHECRDRTGARPSSGLRRGAVDQLRSRNADGRENERSVCGCSSRALCLGSGRESLSRPLLEAWRSALLARGLSASSVNQRLSAVRSLLRQAAGRGALSREEAIELASVPNVKQAGQRLGKWLTEKEAGRLISIPDINTVLGIRNRAILALLVACGVRRDELVRLQISHLQLREGRWVLLDIQGKGKRLRTVPVPHWVKRLLDRWLNESGITEGPLFRTLRKGGALGPAQPLSDDSIYTLVRSSGAAIGHPD